jgi:hypothetical protein
MLQKVTTGQPIDIKAQDWNAMLDAAQAELNRRQDTTGGTMPGGLSPGVIMARNAASQPLPVSQPVVINGFSLHPADTTNPTRITLRLATPAEADARPLGVTLDRCDTGALVRVRVFGPALVRLTRLPSPEETHVAFAPDGALIPSESGPARILAATSRYALILIGDSRQADNDSPKGMFQLLRLPPEPESPPRIRITDGAMPASETAGVATINQQAYSCPAAEFDLTEEPQYFFLKFTPPRIDSEANPEIPACSLVVFSDVEAVVSTESVLYHLIGHAWYELLEDGTPIIRIAQDHPPGNLELTWFGSCLGLLENVIE